VEGETYLSYHDILVKLIDGIQGIDVRSSIIEAFNYILHAYMIGRISDSQLKKDLTSFCLDVLTVKNPGVDPETLKDEAEQWATQLYNGVKVYALWYRFAQAYGRGE
jgi:hypothetical protein